MEKEYELRIAALNEQIANMKKSIEEEREEYKSLYQTYKKNLSNTSNDYVNEQYYKEQVYINTLKTQINNHIKQNDYLKIRNRELIQENEMYKGEFRI